MTMNKFSRREFLKRTAALAATAGSAAPWALTLSAMGEAAAQTADDYKALVCIFLYGGNDYANTVVPYDTVSYAAYQSLRSSIALPRDNLAATALAPDTALPGGHQYALAPDLAPLKTLFDAGNLGVLLNVGTLVTPTTKAQYAAQSVPLPPKLFSHNDQQSYWQASGAEGATSGWGGRMGDLILSGNSNALFSCVSVTGNAVYLSGRQAVQYQLNSTGPVALTAGTSLYGSSLCASTLRSLITQGRTNLLEDEYARVMRRSLDSYDTLSNALAGAPALQTSFGTSNLSAQLKMVARMIAVRRTLGMRRQVFVVSLNGFDTHDFLPQRHPLLLADVATSMKSFFDATVELGVSKQVTAFTASDFGRTLTANGDGSDHGWGSHHFVMGGTVKGRNFWGTPPQTAAGGPDDVGQGRLLPTTSVDQLGAGLASWFGVSGSNLGLVLPNARNFDLTRLKLFG